MSQVITNQNLVVIITASISLNGSSGTFVASRGWHKVDVLMATFACSVFSISMPNAAFTVNNIMTVIKVYFSTLTADQPANMHKFITVSK